MTIAAEEKSIVLIVDVFCKLPHSLVRSATLRERGKPYFPSLLHVWCAELHLQRSTITNKCK